MPNANAIVRPTGHLSPRLVRITTPFIYSATKKISKPSIKPSASYPNKTLENVGGAGISIPVTRSAGVEIISRSGGLTVDNQLPTKTVVNITPISAVINLKTEG